MYWGYHYWGMHVFWWFFWLAIVVLLLATGWPRTRVIAPGSGRDAALDALRMRYAAGEIDEEEYQERRAVLLDTNRAAPRAPARTRDDELPHVPEDRPATGSGADARGARS